MGEMADYYNEQAKMEEAASMTDDPVKVAAERLAKDMCRQVGWEYINVVLDIIQSDPGFRAAVEALDYLRDSSGNSEGIAGEALHLLLHGKENDDA